MLPSWTIRELEQMAARYRRRWPGATYVAGQQLRTGFEPSLLRRHRGIGELSSIPTWRHNAANQLEPPVAVLAPRSGLRLKLVGGNAPGGLAIRCRNLGCQLSAQPVAGGTWRTAPRKTRHIRRLLGASLWTLHLSGGRALRRQTYISLDLLGGGHHPSSITPESSLGDVKADNHARISLVDVACHQLLRLEPGVVNRRYAP